MAAVDDEDDDSDDVGHPSSSYHLYDGIDTIPSDATHVRVRTAVTIIRGDAFLPVRSVLRRVVLPDGLHRIGRHAFRKLVSLKRIDLPDSVDDIEPDAFADCAFTNFRVPAAMTQFDIIIFPSPNSLVSVEVPEGVVLVTHDPVGPIWSWNAELDVLRNVAIPPGCLVEPNLFGKPTCGRPCCPPALSTTTKVSMTPVRWDSTLSNVGSRGCPSMGSATANAIKTPRRS